MQQQALAAVIAWIRLERALENFERTLHDEFGITGLQLAILRLLSERPALALAALRKALVMHAATLGQAVDHLRRLGLCEVRPDPRDRRARLVALTSAGAAMLARTPMAGPMRLRQAPADSARLDRLAVALEDAIALFALDEWAPGARPAPPA